MNEFRMQVLEMFYNTPRDQMSIEWTGSYALVRVGDHPTNGHEFNTEGVIMSFEGQDCYWPMSSDYWESFRVFLAGNVAS